MGFKRDIEDYLTNYCKLTKQYSYNTLRSYRNTLERLEAWLTEKNITQTNQIDMMTVDKYRDFLDKKTTLRKKKMEKRTQAYQIVVLRNFLKYMVKKGVLVLNPDSLELPKTRQRRIEFLTEKEVRKLVTNIANDSDIDNIQRLRNQAIILTIFGSGLRLSELLGLKKSDIDDDGENQLIIQGKGGKIRTTFLAPASIEAIYGYLRERGGDDNPYLFVSHSKNTPKNPDEYKALTPRSVQMMLKNYAIKTGIYKKITPHTLRHSFATKLLSDGGNLRSVQTLLGHSDISSTQIYTHITDWQIRDTHKKSFGSL